MVVSDKGDWVVDPDWEEERTARATFGVGWGFGAGLGVVSEAGGKTKGEETVWFEAEGEFDEEDVSYRRVSLFALPPFLLFLLLRLKMLTLAPSALLSRLAGYPRPHPFPLSCPRNPRPHPVKSGAFVR